MNFISMGFWAAFCAFFLIYIFVKKWSRTAMLLWVLAFDLFFFWQANGWLMLLLPATAAVNYFFTELLRQSKGPASSDTASATSSCPGLQNGPSTTNSRPPATTPSHGKPADAERERCGGRSGNWFFGSGSRKIISGRPLGSARRAGSKWILALIVLLDLAALVYFKYSGFFAGIWNALTGSNFLEFCFYLSFFPLLLAGPITRAGRFLPQIRRAEPATRHELRLGLWLIICGLLKKGVLADYLAVYNNLAFDSPVSYSGYELLMAVLGYTMQIYLDFSGYSDLSIGIASLMGFRLDDNFLYPFRDYVYIPLGGNRKGQARTLLNNFLTMVVAGLWHGSTWMFVIWGALHGAGLAVHKLCRGWLKKIPDSWPVKALSWLLTMVFVMACWVFFRAGSLQDVGEIFRRIFTEFDFAYAAPFWAARKLWCGVLAVAAAGLLIPPRAYNRLQARFTRLPWIVIFLVFLIAVQLVIQLRSGDIQPFIYYQF